MHVARAVPAFKSTSDGPTHLPWMQGESAIGLTVPYEPRVSRIELASNCTRSFWERARLSDQLGKVVALHGGRPINGTHVGRAQFLQALTAALSAALTSADCATIALQRVTTLLP